MTIIIGYADNRTKGGALWIKETPKTDAIIRIFAAAGMRFSFSESKKQWWTSDPSPKSITQKRSAAHGASTANQHAFIGWLRDQCSDSTEIYSIYDVARKIHTMLLSEGIASGLFGMQDLDSVRTSAELLRAKKAFIQSDKLEKGLWVKALNFYLRFAETYLQVLLEDRKTVSPTSEYSETSNPAKAASSSTDAQLQQEDSALEPSLVSVLQDDQFAELRKALINKGIYKLEDFKKLNLWVFLNQNGLYSIGQRQAIYSTIIRILGSNNTVKSKAQWRIVTQEKEYEGTSPAEALMEYCRVIAAKYPLRFRILIGERMPGKNTTPLMSTSVNTDDPCLRNPKVFFNRNIKMR